MKIALVRRGYSATGGAERFLLRFAAALAGAGHVPVLFGSQEWPADHWPGGEIRRVRGRSPGGFARELDAMDPAGECDAVFSLERVRACDVYRAGDGVHRAWLDRRAAFESPWRCRLREWLPKHREILAIETALFAEAGAGRVIANSQMVADEIVREFGFPPDRIDLIRNGLPPGAFEPQPEAREATRTAAGYKREDFVVLFAGSGWARKGLQHAIAAMSDVPVRCRARLVVAGRGKIEAGWKRNVRFLGPVHDLRPWFEASDAFLLPTWYDPFSNACLEAWAAGLPVLTTRANGFSELILPGETGEVIETPRDEVACSEALERWSDPDKRAAARPKIRMAAAPFTIEANVRETLASLEKAARRASHAGRANLRVSPRN